MAVDATSSVFNLGILDSLNNGAVEEILASWNGFCSATEALLKGNGDLSFGSEFVLQARTLCKHGLESLAQEHFLGALQEVDPCEDFVDDDIRTAIQNATGPRNALFVPEVPFEVLVRKQIVRLLDPSLQCLRLVYDELVRMGRACEATEIQRFPVLRRRLDEVMGQFLRDGVEPAERMIGNIIEMEMDYINTSHPNFIGGNRAVELALQQLKSSQGVNDGDKVPPPEKGLNSRAVLPKPILCGVLPNQGTHTQPNSDRSTAFGNSSTRSWGISSIFGSRASPVENQANNKTFIENVHDIEQIPLVIHLTEPPSILKPPETQSDNEAVEVRVTQLLLRSYYDIVRNNIQDLVPKAIMHFLVNNTKRDLLSIFIQKLYRESLYEEMFKEQDEVVTKRKRTKELFHALQQAVQTLDEVEADVSSGGSSSGTDTTTDLPRFAGLSPSSFYLASKGEKKSYVSRSRNLGAW